MANDYEKLLPIWEKCRLVYGGNHDIQTTSVDTKKKFVPALSGQTDLEYSAMVSRATFFNATARTVDGMIGLVFRKNAEVKAPESMRGILDDVCLNIDSKCDIQEFAADVLKEDILVGRVGILIDRPDVDTKGMTQAQVDALNLRPYATIYKAESIIAHRFARVNNASQLVMVRLIENIDIWEGIECKTIEQERRLLLTDIGYIFQLYRKNEKGEWEQFGGDVMPKMNGKSLTYIPFICDFTVTKPPILDLVEANIGHFRTDVDREHGAHKTAVPTPMFAGFEFEEGESFKLGAEGGYSSSSSDAKAFYLEFQGQGLTTLKEIKEEKERQMSVLGARFLEAQQSSAEATDTVRIRKSGETSVLAMIAQKRSQYLTRVLEVMRDWSGATGEVFIKLNTDYVEAGLTGDEALKWMQVQQGGGISQQTLFHVLQRGETYQEGTTFEDEQDRINSQIMSAPIVN